MSNFHLKTPEKIVEGSVPGNNDYPAEFIAGYGFPPSETVANRTKDDWERDANGKSIRRFGLGDVLNNEGASLAYTEAWRDYVRPMTLDELAAVRPLIAQAEQVYIEFGMGKMSFHLVKRPGKPSAIVTTWATANKNLPYEVDSAFAQWARHHRPELLDDPHQSENLKTVLMSPTNTVLEFQTQAIQSGRAIMPEYIHPTLDAGLRSENNRLLKIAEDQLDDALDDIIANLPGNQPVE